MPETTKLTIGLTIEIPLLDEFDPPQIVQRNTLQIGDRYRHLSTYTNYYALGHISDDTPPFEVHQTTNTTELVVGWRKSLPITPADGWQPIDKITNVDNKKWPLVIIADGVTVGCNSCRYTEGVQNNIQALKTTGLLYFLVIAPPPTNK